MKKLYQIFTICIISASLMACVGNVGSDNNENNTEDSYEKSVEKQEKKRAEAEKITKNLCDNFPKDLVLKYNPKGKSIEIQEVNYSSGQLDFCRIILTFGERNNTMRGSVTARAPNRPEPLSRIKPIEGIIQKIDGFGDKAFYMNKEYKLTILKDGLIYDFMLPKDGSVTSTRDDLEVLVELAKHYKLQN